MAIRHSALADNSFTPQGRLAWDAEHVIVPSGCIADGVTDDSVALNAAIATGLDVDLGGKDYAANNLVQTVDGQAIFSSQGAARIIKNGNGPLFTSSGDDVLCENINWRGDASSPTYTGDGAVFTGDNPILINCGSRWMTGRALKATGQHVQVHGTCDIYQTTDATGTGYDVEIGVSGTATLYHELCGVRSSQSTGGILLIDTGSHSIFGGQFGKLKIQAGTGPAGVNGGKTIGARILGATDVEVSTAVLSANQFGAVAITFSAATSVCRFDISNSIQTGGSVINNGNANNLIMREVSTGSTNQIKIGDDNSVAVLTFSLNTGEVEAPSFRMQNNKNFVFERADASSGGILGMTSSNNFYRQNPVSNGAIQDTVTGASGVHQNIFDNGATVSYRIATTLLSAVSGATVTASNLIPDGAFILGVTTRITTNLGTTNGTTGYAVGDSVDPNRWGDIVGTTTSTSSNNANATADFTGAYIAADSVIITAAGGAFDGTGAIRVTVIYLNLTAPSS